MSQNLVGSLYPRLRTTACGAVTQRDLLRFGATGEALSEPIASFASPERASAVTICSQYAENVIKFSCGYAVLSVFSPVILVLDICFHTYRRIILHF
jgi:hypothetical protein